MQSFRSQYGRKGIRVSDRCPTRQIRWKLEQTHVGKPLEEIEAMVRAAVARRRDEGGLGLEWTDELEREAVRFARWQHEENRAEYRFVMGGLFGGYGQVSGTYDGNSTRSSREEE